ncbi:hypothetical protein CANARDRAFT_8749 [[Candida] arabinofermentans NRRL YB-2248]|uniref:Bud site selection protein 5 n=1 Tax=[Candida] arabinofermentans NRRL YB-2248 TaxID=983967 RepID=A0A1E4SY40_9ASCO|nr:hypothetical protein CANARDRAFT_8749 [[Candida] arabinofermentans NRRL YB-2248]
MSSSNSPNDDDGFTFELANHKPSKDSFQTPKVSNLEDFESPDFKGTSPLKLSKSLTSNPKGNTAKDDENMATTPKDKQDFNYIFDQLSPMPGSWILNQGPTFEDSSFSKDETSEVKYGDCLNSVEGSPSSINQRGLTITSLQGEFKQELFQDKITETSTVEETQSLRFAPVSSSIPSIPLTDSLSNKTSNYISHEGSDLTKSLGLFSNGKKETYNEQDHSSTTIKTNEFAIDDSILDQTENTTYQTNNEIDDGSSVSESNFIDLDNEDFSQIQSPSDFQRDTNATPTSNNFHFQQYEDDQTTPVVNDSKRFTNPLDSEDFKFSGLRSSKGASPIMNIPIYEEEEEEDAGLQDYSKNSSTTFNKEPLSPPSTPSTTEKVLGGLENMNLSNAKHISTSSSLYSSRDSAAPVTNLQGQLASIPESSSFRIEAEDGQAQSTYKSVSGIRAPALSLNNQTTIRQSTSSSIYSVPENGSHFPANSSLIQINENEEELPKSEPDQFSDPISKLDTQASKTYRSRAAVESITSSVYSPVDSRFIINNPINSHSPVESTFTSSNATANNASSSGSASARSEPHSQSSSLKDHSSSVSPSSATANSISTSTSSIPDKPNGTHGVLGSLGSSTGIQKASSTSAPVEFSSTEYAQDYQKKPRVSVRQTSLYHNFNENKKNSTINTNAVALSDKERPVPDSKTFGSTNTMDALLANSQSSKYLHDLTSSDTGLFDDGDDDGAGGEEDTSALFVTATYPFDASTLDSENDAAICLSFQQNDIAFTYSLDDSGWGEVTLINTLKRGWVPMNYFRATLVNGLENDDLALGSDSSKKLSSNAKLAASKKPLKKLFKSAGTFLLNPQNKPVYVKGELKGYTFDISYINGITLGIRMLLKETDCISRTSEIVQKKPAIRKLRKKLLRDWSDLIFKAKDYLHTVDVSKIEYLQLMTYQVLQKSITFLDIWALESDDLNSTAQMQALVNPSSRSLTPIVYLNSQPTASYRISEIYNHLITYLALMSGRLDLVEHNVLGCQVLENVNNHVNLLVEELKFIGTITKTLVPANVPQPHSRKGAPAQVSIPEQFKILDSNSLKLDELLVQLNKHVTVLTDVANRRNISNNIKGSTSGRSIHNKNGLVRNATGKSTASRKVHNKQQPLNDIYFYSREGGGVISSSCAMVGLVTSSYKLIRSFITYTKDFELPASRKYPNFQKINISPQQFVKKCSVGLMSDKDVNRQVQQHQQKPTINEELSSPVIPSGYKANRESKRFSIFRAGDSGDMELNPDGLDFLSEIAPKNSSPFISNGDGTFDQFLDNGNSPDIKLSGLGLTSSSLVSAIDTSNHEDEILRGSDNELLGASFKSLVALLTDENSPPDYFFTSTFFLTFRIFSHGTILLEELVSRFDVSDKILEAERRNATGRNMYSSTESKLKTRRKLVCKTFQLWLESYWKPKTDYILLAPLLNFFNEAVKEVLPIEAFKLIEVASKLVGQPPVETIKDRLNYYNNIDNESQLIPRKISPKLQKKHISKHLSTFSFSSPNGYMNELDTYNSFLEDIETYGLEKVETSNSLTASRNSSIGDHQNPGSNSLLLTPGHIETIEKIIISYRNMLQEHWIRNQTIQTNHFVPMDTISLLDSWWKTSQETWKIVNQDLALLNFNGLEIAKQLTLIESKMFCSIKAEELLNQNFTSKKLHLNLSPNIQKSVLFTNLLSDYVIESVLTPNLTMKQRVHALKCWLKVAISCLYLRNFNTLASIMTSLQSFLISRITKIWDGLSEKYKDLFQYLASIIHPDKNYLVYRTKLKEILSSNLEEDLDVPIVPYVSLFLQDLTFIVDGNPNYRTNSKSFLNQKLINIDKYFRITRIISDLQTLQIPYRDVGELGAIYNDGKVDLIRSNTIKNLKTQLSSEDDTNYVDMFDIMGVPCLQELTLLEIWKVKQIGSSEDDRAWKLSCDIQPRDE